MNTTENQNDPYAHLKQAWEDGMRIRNRAALKPIWIQKTDDRPTGYDWSYPPDDYEIEPLHADKNSDQAPAGKLSDAELGEIGAKAAAHWFNENGQEDQQLMYVSETGPYADSDTPARTAFAAAVREAVEKECDDRFNRACKDYNEECARLTAIIEQSIEMVNTPGTTKDNLPQAINAKIIQRDEFHDATLKKLDAAKEEVKRLLRLDATNRENCDRTHKALVESQLLQLETQKALAKATAELERLREKDERCEFENAHMGESLADKESNWRTWKLAKKQFTNPNA